MWKTDDPRMQPQVDEVNCIITSLLDVASRFKVEPDKLVVLMDHQSHKAFSIVTDYNVGTMNRTLYGARVMRVADLEGYAIVMSPDVTDTILKESVLGVSSKLLKESINAN